MDPAQRRWGSWLRTRPELFLSIPSLGTFMVTVWGDYGPHALREPQVSLSRCLYPTDPPFPLLRRSHGENWAKTPQRAPLPPDPLNSSAGLEQPGNAAPKNATLSHRELLGSRQKAIPGAATPPVIPEQINPNKHREQTGASLPARSAWGWARCHPAWAHDGVALPDF